MQNYSPPYIIILFGGGIYSLWFTASFRKPFSGKPYNATWFVEFENCKLKHLVLVSNQLEE